MYYHYCTCPINGCPPSSSFLLCTSRRLECCSCKHQEQGHPASSSAVTSKLRKYCLPDKMQI
uniref:Uncharacterized protein n=1 Tax=Setaria italica TaxID=4555 RepID=K3YE19_SETIT